MECLSVSLSVSSVVYHIYACCLQKPYSGFKCHLADGHVGFIDTLLDGCPWPWGKKKILGWAPI